MEEEGEGEEGEEEVVVEEVVVPRPNVRAPLVEEAGEGDEEVVPPNREAVVEVEEVGLAVGRGVLAAEEGVVAPPLAAGLVVNDELDPPGPPVRLASLCCFIASTLAFHSFIFCLSFPFLFCGSR